METDRDERDALLDEALRSYTPEPRPGIEGRVLSRVRHEAKRKRLRWIPLALAIPMVFAVGVFLYVSRQASPAPARVALRPKVASPAKVQGPILNASQLPASVLRRPTRVDRRTGGAHYRVLATRPDRFPTPSALTPEERALLRFVSGHPMEAGEIAAEQNETEPAPIQIPALQIPPLSSRGGS